MANPPIRPGLGPWHVDRPRLGARGMLTVVEAGTGYGKTAFARELAFRDGRALVEVGFTPSDSGALGAVRRVAVAVRGSPLGTASRLADLGADDAEALTTAIVAAFGSSAPEPVLLVLDDVHHLDDDGARSVAAMVTALIRQSPEGLRILVCGRRIPLVFSAGPADLTAADLAMQGDEAATVLRQGWEVHLTPAALASLDAACGGWPAAVVLAAPRLASAGRLDVGAAATRAGAVPNLLADLLAPLADADVQALAQSARLPLLGPALDRPLGHPGLFDRSRAAGLPYLATSDGWFVLPDAVREQLTVYASVDPAPLLRVAQEYVRRGLAVAGATALLDAGEKAAAADLIAGLAPGRVDDIDLAVLQALVDRISPAELDRRPEILVHLARACIPAVAIHRRADALTRAAAATDPASPTGRCVAAEQALDLVRDGHPDEASAEAARLLAECGSEEVLTRARAFDVLGRAMAWKAESDAELRTAGEHLRTAAALATTADVRGIQAEVLLALGYAVEFPLGRLEAAVEAMDAALAKVPGRLRRRATIQTFRADVLHGLGRDDEATEALTEASDLARLLGDDRLAAYAAWEAAKGASRRGEHDRTLDLIDEVHRHRGPWFDHPTGMVFLADAAECCERIGETALAASYLQRAEDRMHELLGEDDLSVWMAKAGCAARSGDPADALAALDTVDRLPGLAPKDRWRPIALRAMAVARRGDRPAAASLARAALDEAAACGTARLPDVLEPSVATVLRGLLAEASTGEGPVARIEVLGGFTVRRGGRVLDSIPAGLPALLVKLLAVSGGRVHPDVAIDRLWPDGDLAGANQRLRNVLHRLRDADLVRRDGTTLALAPGVRVDLTDFDVLAARAAAAGPSAGAAVARQALALYGGPLLPDDPYLDWTVASRERARRVYLDLLDLLAADAEARGAVDIAVDYLEQGLTADPDAEPRAIHLARLHASAGRTTEALRILDRATAALAELGVGPSAEHRRVRADLIGS